MSSLATAVWHRSSRLGLRRVEVSRYADAADTRLVEVMLMGSAPYPSANSALKSSRVSHPSLEAASPTARQNGGQSVGKGHRLGTRPPRPCIVPPRALV